MTATLKRREFLQWFVGAAVATASDVARAQGEHMRSVGVLFGSVDHAEARGRLGGFTDTIRQLGWIEGQNVRLDIRWSGTDRQIIAANARELVRLKPDVIFAAPSNAVIPLQKETRTIPIVFAGVSDPIAQGVVQNLARPTGNATGFANLEHSLMGKWVQILKDAAPGLKRIGLAIHTGNAASPLWYRMFGNVAPSLGIEPVALPIKERGEIEGFVKSMASKPNSAMIVAGDTLVSDPPVRNLIVGLAAQHKLPTLYGETAFAEAGGLIAYGIDRIDPYRRAASYVDRILKGEKPSDLPVQQPNKFHFVINLKTAKALGLELPPNLVATADLVIE